MNGSVYSEGWVDARGICDQPKVFVYLPKGTLEVYLLYTTRVRTLTRVLYTY